ncbi:MAG TPA: RdgB/HAM1 family non-canonical purine NTP pyrophosphatase [Candidatus Thermoplasmatota archaeon]|nr:RdgB/HAM1 family non-canonical purine NTP pyrophosphatase [Candidatus Thermoplasmatota archaeon]
MRITFVTGNKGKLHEATEALAPLGHEVVGADLAPVEIQADSLEAISRAKCEVLVGRVAPPFMVDDGGLFVHALKDFPGVFSAHALKTIGVPGILKLMEGVEDRRARFEAVVTLHDGAAVRPFHGRCDGTLTTQPRAAGHGFGFDPIFVPDGQTRTFAELPADYKNRFSHRGRALAKLAAHLGGA